MSEGKEAGHQPQLNTLERLVQSSLLRVPMKLHAPLASGSTDCALLRYSILDGFLSVAWKESEQDNTTTTRGEESPPWSKVASAFQQEADEHRNATLHGRLSERIGSMLINDFIERVQGADSAAGTLVGLVLGDILGSQFDGLPAEERLPSNERPTILTSVVVTSSPTNPSGNQPQKDGQPTTTTATQAAPSAFHRSPTDPQVQLEASNNTLCLIQPFNRWNLRFGQWSDTGSQALCLADSLISCRGYKGSDALTRYFNWWFHGYNNPFRFQSDASLASPKTYDEETKRIQAKSSVGLGMSTSRAIYSLMKLAQARAAPDAVPSRYSLQPIEQAAQKAHNTRSTGNASLCRVAPIAIRFHQHMEDVLNAAEESSYTTHPSTEAAMCCRFVSFFIVKCIVLHKTSFSMEGTGTTTTATAPRLKNGGPVKKGLHAPQHQVRELITLSSFVDLVIEKFLAHHETILELGSQATSEEAMAMLKLRALLMCAPPTDCEGNWSWKLPILPITETVTARMMMRETPPEGATAADSAAKYFSGEMKSFGSSAFDCLSLALHCLFHARTFQEVILRASNFCGASAAVAGLAGQMAGAFFGLKAVQMRGSAASKKEGRQPSSELFSKGHATAANSGNRAGVQHPAAVMDALRQWDPQYEIELRALILFVDGNGVATM